MLFDLFIELNSKNINQLYTLFLYNLYYRSLGCVLYELIYLKQAYPSGVSSNSPKLNFDQSFMFSKILTK